MKILKEKRIYLKSIEYTNLQEREVYHRLMEQGGWIEKYHEVGEEKVISHYEKEIEIPRLFPKAAPEKKFLVKYLTEKDYDSTELTEHDILDVISELAGDLKFTDGWQSDVRSEIRKLEINQVHEVNGQFDCFDKKMFVVKRIV